LIIKPSSLGDIVLALPTLTALCKSFPSAKISWLVRPDFSPLFENHPCLSETILFDRKFLGKAWYNWRAFVGLLSLIRRLRRSKFDLVIDLQGLFRTAFLGWVTGCKKRFGMANARELAHIFYTHKICQNQHCIHLVDYYLKIIQTVCNTVQPSNGETASCSSEHTDEQAFDYQGVKPSHIQFLLPVDSAAVDRVNRLLMANGIDPGRYAVLVPCSAHEEKCWPTERFAALANRISQRFGLSIIATGTALEADIVERLNSLANVQIANFAGKTSLNELIALLKSAALVVSNDTGPGHIAAALDTPLVMIFGQSNPARVAPCGSRQCAAAIEPDSRGIGISSNDPKHDIKAVTVDEVYQMVCEQMKL